MIVFIFKKEFLRHDFIIDFCSIFYYIVLNMMTEERIAKLTSAVYKVTDLFPEKEPLKFVVRRESLDVLFSCVSLSSKPNLGQKEKFIKKAIISSRAIIRYLDLAEMQNWADKRNFSILKSEYSDLVFWLEEQILNLEMEAKNTLNSISSVYVDNSEDVVELNVSRVEQKPMSSQIEKVREDGVKGIEDNELILDSHAKKGEVKIKKEIKKEQDIEAEPKKEKTAFEVMPNVVIDYEELSSIQLKTLEILQNKGFLKASQIGKYFEDTSERSVRREIKELKDKSIIIAKGSGRSTFYEINHVY